MSRPYKSLFIATWYPNVSNPEEGIFIRRHARVLLDVGVDVRVVYVRLGTHRRRVQAKNEDGLIVFRAEARLARLGSRALQQIVNGWRYMLAMAQAVRVATRDWTPDIIHAHVLHPGGLAALVASCVFRVPFLVTEHSAEYLPQVGGFARLPWLVRTIDRLVARQAAVVTTVSRTLRDAMRDCGLDAEYHVIGNVVELCNEHQVRDSDSACNRRRKHLIAHVSSMTESSKNVSGLLRAVRLLAERRRDFVVVLAGEGPDTDALRKLSHELGLDRGIVRFVGRLSEQRVMDLLRRAAFVVMSSNYETFSVVLAESLACGTPVVATRCGGPEEYIDDEMGILVSPGDEAELADAMDRMLQTFPTYDSARMRAHIAKHYGAEAIASKFLEIYDTLLEHRRA